MDRAAHRKTLERAADIVGGKVELRRRLRVPMRELEDWMAGTTAPPTDVFLIAVDIISSMPVLSDGAAADSPRDLHARLELDRRRHPERRRFLSPLAFLTAEFRAGDLSAIVDGAVDAAIRASGAEMGNLQLVCSDGLRIVAHEGFAQPFLSYFELVNDAGSACAQALRQGRRVVVADVESDPLFAGTEAGRVLEAAEVRAVQSTPIFFTGGEIMGVISTHYRTPREPGERELAYIDEISARTAFLLEREAA